MASTSGFELIAAVDLRGGRVVRLRRGDFRRETTYGDHPVAVARRLIDEGATWLHVVDLDGARAGRPQQSLLISAIAQAVDGRAALEVGGGLRTMDSLTQAFGAGAARVVLGTAALRQAAFVGRAVSHFGVERICVALDVRDGRALVNGWMTRAGSVPVQHALEKLADVGVTTFEVTAVERDGTLTGPDLDLLARLVGLDRGRIIASGGIASVDDVRAIRDVGCAGGIVGRALYEGRIDLPTAMTLVTDPIVARGRPVNRTPSR